MSRQIRAVLSMTVPVENSNLFEREWRRVAGWVESQPGCLRQTLSRGQADEPLYVITSDWIDLGAFRAFETSSRQDAATAGLRALRRSAHMEILTIVDHRETR